MTASSPEMQARLISFQRNEITEHHIYRKLANAVPPGGNRTILNKIADDELRHYQEWKKYTSRDIGPSWLKVWFYFLICRFSGFTFGIKLMEKGEDAAQRTYGSLRGTIDTVDAIIREENDHENALLDMLDEERLRYTGSIVLGLNDALVELTGVLAGLTLALQNSRLVALTGLITGIAAALSMAASEYLSTKAEGTSLIPLKSAMYTGIAYVATVAVLVFPYLLFNALFLCLTWVLFAALLIIALFNYYIAVAKDLPFKTRFLEMAAISLGVAFLSFMAGYLLRTALGVEP
jgi:VIT1/CCC1 family predicted Fe2+/Mn2+ transporter